MSDTPIPPVDADTPEPSDPIQPIQLQDEMENSFLDYAMSVIMARALPDVRDGLKPVHRRIIWDMEQQGFRPDRNFVKCARVTGHTMANYHPHGNQAIYDALVRMAQPFSLRHTLIDFHGNQGIAVGMATNIPPHNLGEVIDATIHKIDHPEANPDQLMEFVKGPDFPTGGQIL